MLQIRRAGSRRRYHGFHLPVHRLHELLEMQGTCLGGAPCVPTCCMCYLCYPGPLYGIAYTIYRVRVFTFYNVFCYKFTASNVCRTRTRGMTGAPNLSANQCAQSRIIIKMARHLHSRCVLLPVPWVPGVPTKTRLESSIKKLNHI